LILKGKVEIVAQSANMTRIVVAKLPNLHIKLGAKPYRLIIRPQAES
jgi:hypothetical protein